MQHKSIRLFYSRRLNNKLNFGDDISPLLVSQLTQRKVDFARVSTCDVASIGSIMEMLLIRRWKRVRRLRFDKIKIWGSGFMRSGEDYNQFLLKPIAVRGNTPKVGFAKVVMF